MKRLDECLKLYSTEDYYPFHMPGHKRQSASCFCENPFSIDITEIEGFDNLHHAQGVIARAQERAAELYGADRTWYLVNGSTCGILAAVSACTTFGGTILMARNCHRAAYHAAYLRRLKTEYLFPEKEPEYGLNGGISPEEVKRKLKENPDIQAVLITSPTYDGVISDIEEIAQIVHAHGIPLIVDEAHGAHLGFCGYFPDSAISHHADLVIHSLHKTMPALTQTALLQQKGTRVSGDAIQRFLSIYQTSSPSYVLMASMDACVGMIAKEGKELFAAYAKKLFACREQLKALEHLRLVPEDVEGSCGIYRMDPSKLILYTGYTNLDGPTLYHQLLDDYHLQMEMDAPEYVLAMTSVMDTQDGYDRLCSACEAIDRRLETKENRQKEMAEQKPKAAMTIAEAWERDSISVPYENCAGKVFAEYIYLYPPGIPLAVPGEILTEELLMQVKDYQKRKLKVQGPQDDSLESLQMVIE
ncbi:MAG: aminotransferase class I/II-fold pyridoxal phosphate-dependent enzyme [Lachnospiraceae bacterium]|jgi:arginine decarboxylase